MQDRHYIYHPDYEPITVSSSEYYERLEQGWYDTPAKFPTNKIEEQKGMGATMESSTSELKKRGRPRKEIANDFD